MIRCGIVEDNEAMLARFMGGLNKEIQTILEYKEYNEAMLARSMGGLNKEIQTILEYKEYNNITRLFHLACKAEREV